MMKALFLLGEQNPIQIDEEEIGQMVILNNKIKIPSTELKYTFRR